MKKQFIFCIGLVIIIVELFVLCKNESEQTGEELAKIYCSNCHLFTEPELLDKETWVNGVLPNMGLRLGIKDSTINPYAALTRADSTLVKERNIYPEQAVITKEQWTKIVNYFEQKAPETLPAQERTVVNSDKEALFEAKIINVLDKVVPEVTLLEYNGFSSQLAFGDGNTFFTLANHGETTTELALPSMAVDVDFRNSETEILTIGSLSPSDQKLGQLFSVDANGTTSLQLSGLQRPVSFESGDLNNDQIDDIIVCEFGNYTGTLSVYKNKNHQEQIILSALPGSRKVEIKDMNQDGLPDIVALFAQAYEQISIFYNQGDYQFTNEIVLEFPPVYGVSYFEMHDFNQDGFQDILVSNGDNWDYSSIDKPYHGFRIFLNDGSDRFDEEFFYPMYGCSKAMSYDFDQDGDLDIVATSFYAELKNPSESFVYLENDGSLNFTASFIEEAKYGKWMVMDIGDFNQDGKEDVFLGSLIFNTSELFKVLGKGIDELPQILVLYNEN